jgi:hypothetical protein
MLKKPASDFGLTKDELILGVGKVARALTNNWDSGISFERVGRDF